MLFEELLDIVDRRFHTPLTRAAGWSVIVGCVFFVLLWFVDDIGWFEKSFVIILGASMAFILISGFHGIARYRGSMQISAISALTLLLMYAGLMLAVVLCITLGFQLFRIAR